VQNKSLTRRGTSRSGAFDPHKIWILFMWHYLTLMWSISHESF
jgi:hypothetical protein